MLERVESFQDGKVLVIDSIFIWVLVNTAPYVIRLIIKCIAKVFAILLEILLKVSYILLGVSFEMSIFYSTQIVYCSCTQPILNAFFQIYNAGE